jgi:hypothetical protein
VSSPFDLSSGDLPPQLRAMLKQQETERAVMLDQMEAAEIANRERLLAFAWLTCTCRKWFSWDEIGVPPQSECAVHGNIMITRSGRVL